MVNITFWDVIIQNLGKGIAKNVQFKFQNLDGSNATDNNNHLVKVFNKLTLFQTGFASLGLGQTIKSFLFGFGDLEAEVGKEQMFNQRILILIEFEDTLGNQYKNSVDIDFSNIEGISSLGGSTNPNYSIFRELEKIRKIFEPVFKSGSKRLKVDTYNSSEREKEQLEKNKRDAKLLAKHKKSPSNKSN